MIPINICGLSESVQQAIIQLLSTDSRIVSAKLFGSRAKGNFKPGSDIDLAVDAPNWKLPDLLAFQSQVDDLLLPYKIDIVLLHYVDEQALLDHIHRVGINFYH